MGFLTRRQPALSDPLAQPVDVRRTPAEPLPPLTVVMPAAAPAISQSPATSTTSHVTQNFFYPPPQPAAPSAPIAPASNPSSYQTTIHHHYAPRPDRKLSFSGTVGLVLAGLACAATKIPAAQPFAVWLAVGGAAAGGLGILSSRLLGLTRAGVPLLAILAAAGALVMSSRTPGSLSPLDTIRSAIPKQFPTIPLLEVPTQPATPNPAPSVAAQRSKPTVAAAYAPPQLEAARETAGRAIGIDYAALVDQRTAAAASLQQARATMELGSPELIQANQRFIQADAALIAARHRLQDDPAVAAAQGETQK